jgi:hypothetical protein
MSVSAAAMWRNEILFNIFQLFVCSVASLGAGIVNMLQDGRHGVQIPVGASVLSPLHNILISSKTHTNSSSASTVILFKEVKRVGA